MSVTVRIFFGTLDFLRPLEPEKKFSGGQRAGEAKTAEVNTAEVRKPAEGPTMEVMGDLQSKVEDGMLKLASGKSVPVITNCAALRDP
ncbi:hypothetical protein PoB_000104000 [Plakobranchus ocellatus]|uniref:Uncharacterized protein n=1 Tax=Plakobranchus ocellatus TaxID=259542 RepID=A0AAV3XV88_9GAST|nr:hypothetical protein PoB_000104000 [Plakobranchus ocellatus]